MSLPLFTMLTMGSLVDLEAWRRARPRDTGTAPGQSEDGVQRLERAIDRMYPLVSRALDASGSLEPRVETELLAIMGELTMGLVGEAARRAERLTRRLANAKRA